LTLEIRVLSKKLEYGEVLIKIKVGLDEGQPKLTKSSRNQRALDKILKIEYYPTIQSEF